MKKTKIIFIAIMIISILTLIVTNSYAQTEKVKNNGVYKIAIGKDSSKTVEVAGSSKDNNAKVDIWSYGNVPAQKFYFEYQDGFYKITAMHTGKSLTAKNNSIKEGTEIVQASYSGSNGQKWVLKDTKKNGWVISPLSNTNLSITVQGSIKNGSKMILSKTKNDDNQMLYLFDLNNSEKAHSNGIYKIAVGSASNKTMEVAGSSQSNNAKVDIWNYGNVPAQKFYFEYKEGYYKIIAMHTGKSLTAKNNSIQEGAEVVQADYTGNNSQKWILRDSHKNGWVISPIANPSLAITIQGSIQNGSKMILSNTRDNSNQMYYIYNLNNSEKTKENSTYEVLVGADSNKGLEVSGSNKNNNATVDIWNYGNAAAQKFKFEYVNGYYKITVTHTGKSLTAKNNSIKEGTEIVQSDYTGSDGQKWLVKDSKKNGWIISPLANPSLCITVKGSIQNGSKIILSQTRNNNNQMFYLVQAPNVTKTIANGTYELAIGANRSKAIEVAGSSQANNAKVDIWNYGNSRAQKFNLEYVNGYYKITVAHSGKSLTVKGNNIKNGIEIVQDDYKGEIGQMWMIVDTKINGWVISPVARQDLAITVQNKIENGSKIILEAKQKSSNRQMLYLFKTNISVNINTAKYPGVAEALDKVAAAHPNWQFEILYTNLDFYTAVKGEYQYANKQGNLVYTPTYGGNWIASNPYVSGVWASASYNGIAYFMDTRNFLNDVDIFQFVDLGNYASSGATLNSIQYQVNGTFLEKNAENIRKACQNKNINPYYVIARLFQEQGKNGSATINMDGGNGKKYYNPFNIGAVVGNDVATALEYAKKGGWDTMQKGLEGGIKMLKSNYIDKKQNTLYLNKFDVNPASGGGLYNHQYMQNLSAAYSEARTFRSAYVSTGTLNNKIKFVIPVFENMPKSPASKPTGSSGSQTVSGEKVVVKTNDGSGVKLRKGPGTTYDTIAYLSDGTVGTRTVKGKATANGFIWDEVVLTNGLKGYVATNYLQKSN